MGRKRENIGSTAQSLCGAAILVMLMLNILLNFLLLSAAHFGSRRFRFGF